MSQKTVERIIGKLATDERARYLYRSDPQAAVDFLTPGSEVLSQEETEALCSLDLALLECFADGLDPRLQRIWIPPLEASGSGT